MKKRILFLDDPLYTNEVKETIEKELDYIVKEVTSSSQALDLINNDSVDLFILELFRDGDSFVFDQKYTNPRPNLMNMCDEKGIPVIITSAQTLSDLKEIYGSAVKNYDVKFIEKNYSIEDELIPTIKDLLTKRILILDDPEVADNCGEWIEEDLGYAVDIAYNSYNAFKLFKENSYDALVVEPWRPGDGPDILQRMSNQRIELIRKCDEEGVSVVITTCLPSKELINYNYSKLSKYEIFNKPYSTSELLNTLSMTLENKPYIDPIKAFEEEELQHKQTARRKQ